VRSVVPAEAQVDDHRTIQGLRLVEDIGHGVPDRLGHRMSRFRRSIGGSCTNTMSASGATPHPISDLPLPAAMSITCVPCGR
jgi:hypothetical protein